MENVEETVENVEETVGNVEETSTAKSRTVCRRLRCGHRRQSEHFPVTPFR